ncbi:restriction endonuclease subunit S [Tetragenococcus halophilus]|uniref:restriction endonuclease subunit S n=1 Tax=Tetragenococcus halophilus TaxID=51669 RepID=UPI001F43778C|nr:restriction endonuclease subunit S [Tetragenococcus halophilus]MCF1684229.1 restriction endonuclease subunit S [Tetragenococcus halophilus]
MSKEEKRAPEVRFEGFHDDWKQRKLGDISEKVTEKNKDKKFTETFTNSAEYGIVPQNDFFDKVISNSKNISNYYIVQNDDFIYNPRISNFAPVGPIKRNKLNKVGVMSPLYYVFRTKNIDLTFLEKFFDTSYWHRFMKLNGDTGARADRFAIKDSVFKEMPVPYPSSDEQTKIGNLLKQIDRTIALHQRKLEKLQKLKKAALQSFFPKKDELMPKVRFANFSGLWNQRKLGEMGDTFAGLSGKTKKDFGHGNTKFITYVNVFKNPISDPKGTESIEIDNKQTEVRYGDIFFTTSSETPEEVGMSSIWLENTENVYLNSFCFGYRLNIKNDPYYLAFLLRSSVIRKKLMLLAQGISRYNISKKKVMEITIPIPTLEEQKHVGLFLKKIDNTITLHQQKLEKLQNCKKSFLQKMFI